LRFHGFEKLTVAQTITAVKTSSRAGNNLYNVHEIEFYALQAEPHHPSKIKSFLWIESVGMYLQGWKNRAGIGNGRFWGLTHQKKQKQRVSI